MVLEGKVTSPPFLRVGGDGRYLRLRRHTDAELGELTDAAVTRSEYLWAEARN